MKTTNDPATVPTVSIQLHPELCEILVQLRQIENTFIHACGEIEGKGTDCCKMRIDEFYIHWEDLVNVVFNLSVAASHKEIFES